MSGFDLEAVLAAYDAHFPQDKSKYDLFRAQAGRQEVMNDRKNFTGHVTGAAIVLSPDHSRVLLIHHRVLDRWLQPGGHWDPGESDPLAAAKREAEEETSVKIASYLPVDELHMLVPIQIDTHYIPANQAKQEPEHYHHDFRYVFEAASEDLSHDDIETLGARWFALDAPETAEISEALQRTRTMILGGHLT